MRNLLLLLVSLSIPLLFVGCATTDELSRARNSLNRRCSELETRTRNLEDFKSEQAVTNGKITEMLRLMTTLSAKLKSLEGDTRKLKTDVRKSLGLTEDFFSSAETIQTQLSQVRQQMNQSLTVLLERLRTEREALDLAIKQIEAGKEGP